MDVKDLKAGDILLYSPTKWDPIGLAISALTLSPACHAGLYMGNGQVAEEISKGLVEDSVSESFGHRKIYVKRLRNPKDMKPVSNVAGNYLSQEEKYGYADIILLSASILSADFEKLAVIFQWDIKTKWVECFRKIAEHAVLFLKFYYDVIKKRHPMICSQFVYTCYDEAGKDYKLNCISSDQTGNTLLSHAEKCTPKAVSLPQGIGIEELYQQIVKACEELLKIFPAADKTDVAADGPGVTELPEDLLETVKALDDALQAGVSSDKNRLGDPSLESYRIKPSDLYDRCVNTEFVGTIQLT